MESMCNLTNRRGETEDGLSTTSEPKKLGRFPMSPSRRPYRVTSALRPSPLTVVYVRRRLSGRVRRRNQVSGFLIDSLTCGGRGELRPRVRHSGEPGEDQNKRKEDSQRAEKGGVISHDARCHIQPEFRVRSLQKERIAVYYGVEQVVDDVPCAAASSDYECINY
ncbi:hypothetical protein BDW72DRAFT_168171 [Aspergillus terricola var. indicus]